MDKVSVIITVYNSERFLARCIESVIDQTYQNLEIIIVNDGSTDSSLNICRRYERMDMRISVYSQDNEGVAAARNAGLFHASGTYTLFVDSDDYAEKNMVMTLMNAIRSDNSDIVVCGYYWDTEYDSVQVSPVDRKSTMSGNNLIKTFLYHQILNGSLWNKLVKTTCYKRFQFDKKVSYGEDALMIWNIISHNNTRMAFIPDSLYHHVMNENSISHSFNERQLTSIWVWKRIARSIESRWPEYTSLVHADQCSNATMVLYEAARCNFPENETMKEMRYYARKYWPQMFRILHSTKKKTLGAILLGYHYRIACKVIT